MKKFIPFGVLIIVIILALIYPSIDIVTIKDSLINSGDTAWLLVSTALSTDNDTRPRIFLRRHGEQKKRTINHDAKLCMYGRYYHYMGNIRFQPCLWR